MTAGRTASAPAPTQPTSSPRVSVVIPAYNAAATLSETLASVFAQTFTDYEVVVVDDGSTDSTREVLARYHDRVRVLSKMNEGKPASTRNLGVRNARGDYVAFLDADDRWRPEKLELQVAVLDQNPAVGLVYTGAVVIDAEGRELKVRSCSPEARGRIDRLLSVRNVMVGSSVVARRRAIEEAGGFDENLTSIENWDLWVRIARRWSVEFVDQPLTLYRVHAGNRSADVELRKRNIFRIIAKNHDPRDRSREARRLRRDAYFNAYYYVLGMGYFERLEMAPAASALWRAFCLKPQVEILRLLGLALLGRRGFMALKALRGRLGRDLGPGDPVHEGSRR